MKSCVLHPYGFSMSLCRLYFSFGFFIQVVLYISSLAAIFFLSYHSSLPLQNILSFPA